VAGIAALRSQGQDYKSVQGETNDIKLAIATLKRKWYGYQELPAMLKVLEEELHKYE
jgi:hypothetical protein